MSVQRYRTNHISGDYYPDNGGELVLYADHVTAMSHAVQTAEIQAVAETEAAERARIKAAVQAIREAGDMPGVIAKSTVLSIIDGDDDAA